MMLFNWWLIVHTRLGNRLLCGITSALLAMISSCFFSVFGNKDLPPCGTICMLDYNIRVYIFFCRCGPQPNSKLLINYGFVDEDNPYDRLVVEV